MTGLAGSVTLGRGVRPDVDAVSRMLEALEGRRWGPRRIWGAAILAMAGKNEFGKMRGLPKTAETVKKIPNAATGNEEKN